MGQEGGTRYSPVGREKEGRHADGAAPPLLHNAHHSMGHQTPPAPSFVSFCHDALADFPIRTRRTRETTREAKRPCKSGLCREKAGSGRGSGRKPREGKGNDILTRGVGGSRRAKDASSAP